MAIYSFFFNLNSEWNFYEGLTRFSISVSNFAESLLKMLPKEAKHPAIIANNKFIIKVESYKIIKI